MRRIGATCTAAQTYTRRKDMPVPEYDRNGGGIRRRRRVPVGMASVVSHRPIARVAAGRSAGFRPLTCDRRHQHTVSAQIFAIFRRHERQSADHPLGDVGRRRCEWVVTATEARSFYTEDRARRVAPATSERHRQGSGGRGHGTSEARKRRSISSPPGHHERSGAESARPLQHPLHRSP